MEQTDTLPAVVPQEAQPDPKSSAAQNWLDQLICPECKVQYPERTISYTNPRALGSHRRYKHGIDPEGPKPQKFEKGEDGTYICPECKQAGFSHPLAVGRHRLSEHNIQGTSLWSKKYRKGLKPGPQPKKASAPKTDVMAERVARDKAAAKESAPMSAVIYLYSKAESLIEAYARENGLVAKPLIRQVAGLLMQAS